MRHLSFIFLLGCMVDLFSQTAALDSLKYALSNAKEDSTRCNILNQMIEAEEEDAVWSKYNERLKKIVENQLQVLDPKSPLIGFYKCHYAYAINNMGYLFRKNDPAMALKYYEKSLLISSEVHDKKDMATTLSNMGYLLAGGRDKSKAVEYFAKCIPLKLELGDSAGAISHSNLSAEIYEGLGNIEASLQCRLFSLKLYERQKKKERPYASLLTSLGMLYHKTGNDVKALEYEERSLKVYEKLKDTSGYASVISNIGLVYFHQKEFDLARLYYKRSMTAYTLVKDKDGVATQLNNIGLVSFNEGDTAEALRYYSEAIEIKRKLKNDKGLAMILLNKGFVYETSGKLKEALDYYSEALNLNQKIGFQMGVAYALNDLGLLYIRKKEFARAIEFSLKSMKIARELGYPELIRNSAEALYKAYKETGKYESSLENFGLYVKMRDSILNDENKKAGIRTQLNYEYEKKAMADSIKVMEEKRLAKAQLKQEQTQRYVLYSGLGLVGLFSLFMVNRFRVASRQKRLIEEQKKVVEEQKLVVEEKQKEILDSIHYARRIQRALITSDYYVSRELRRLKKE